MIVILRLLLPAVAAVFLVGCASTADLTAHESSTCEVHHCAMTIETVPCHPGGTSDYLPAFQIARQSQFPHHGGWHFSEDHGYMYARQLRTHVCPECTKSYERWQTAARSPLNSTN